MLFTHSVLTSAQFDAHGPTGCCLELALVLCAEVVDSKLKSTIEIDFVITFQVPSAEKEGYRRHGRREASIRICPSSTIAVMSDGFTLV